MSQETKRYEGMFVLPAGETDFEAASAPVREVLSRYQAEVLMLKAWDDRRLAYDIRGHKRGLYALSFFSADPSRIREIEHDCQLDERILRVLILRRDRLTDEEIETERASTAKPAGPRDSHFDGERRRGRYRRDEERGAEASPSETPAPAGAATTAPEAEPAGEEQSDSAPEQAATGQDDSTKEHDSQDGQDAAKTE